MDIISTSNTNVAQMQEWAKSKNAHQSFIDLAPTFYQVGIKHNINPSILYCQSAKETGYMKFGGVLNSSFKNPCGLKITKGGGDYDKEAHKRFNSWEEGITAQAEHLLLYAGAKGYPLEKPLDPRHFPFLLGQAPTVESLGGKWAGSKEYGNDIVKMVNTLENTPYKKVETIEQYNKNNFIIPNDITPENLVTWKDLLLFLDYNKDILWTDKEKQIVSDDRVNLLIKGVSRNQIEEITNI